MLAVVIGVFLAELLLVPFVFRSYRKRGEVGLGPGVLAWRPRSHRGLSGLVSGLRVVDARAPLSEEPSTPVRQGARRA